MSGTQTSAASRIIFEQSNDFLTSDIFKATNRHEGEIGVDEKEEDDSASTDNYIIQLLLRFLRFEHIVEEEKTRKKRKKNYNVHINLLFYFYYVVCYCFSHVYYLLPCCLCVFIVCFVYRFF